MQRLYFKLLDRFLAWRAYWLIALFVLTWLAVVLALQVRFDFTPQAVFQRGDDLVSFNEEFKETFGYDDTSLFLLIRSNGRRDLLHRDLLNWQLAIARDLAALESVVDVLSLPTVEVPYRRFRPLALEETFRIAPLAQRQPVDEWQEARLRGILAEDSSFDEIFISKDRLLGGIVVKLDPEQRRIEGLRRSVQQVTDLLTRQPPPDGYSWGLSGLPALRAQVVADLSQEHATLLPLAGFALLVVLAAAFRRASGALLPVIAVGMGLAWTIALMVLADQSIGIVNNMLPLLLIVIGASNCVHVVSRYAEEAELCQGNRLIATRRTLQSMIPACLLTYGTTAVGFLSLTSAGSYSLREMGVQSGVGLALLYFATIAVLGGLLPSFRPPRHERSSGFANDLTDRSLASIGRLVERHASGVAVAGLALLVLGGWLARGVPVNSYNMEAYSTDHPLSRWMHDLDERMGGYLGIEICLIAPTADELLSVDVIRRVNQLQKDLVRHAGVIRTQSYVDLFQIAFARFRGDPDARENLPEDDEKARQQLDLSQYLLETLGEDDSGLNSFLSREKGQARILVRVKDNGTRRTLEIVEQIKQDLAEHLPESMGIDYRLTGQAYVYAVSMDRFVRDLLWSLAGASVVVFILVSILFRSVRFALIAAPPNLTPLVLTFGYMALRGYELSIATSIVFAVSLGVAVDDTIHFLARYREESRSGYVASDAAQRALRGTGRAILLTTLIMLTGLFVLSMSNFIPTRRFAELMGVTMVSALLGDLLLLPACLALLSPGNNSTTPGPRASRETEPQPPGKSSHLAASVARSNR